MRLLSMFFNHCVTGDIKDNEQHKDWHSKGAFCLLGHFEFWDPKGNVSNFCKPEHIFEYNGQLASYVQTCGSMPFYWSHRPCVKYMPKPKVTGSNEQN